MLFKADLALVQRRHLESAVAEQREELEEQSHEPNGNGQEQQIIGDQTNVQRRSASDTFRTPPAPPKKAALTSF